MEPLSVEFIYLSAGFSIYPHQHLIKKDANSIQVRPKTFALLLLLLENPREVLSKRFLLDTIWDDVTVDEPVLVQSIREIRQLFGDADIIQTYPRKGYAWIAEVKKQTIEEEIKPNDTDALHIPQQTPTTDSAPAPVILTAKKHSRTYMVLAAITLIICILFTSSWLYVKKTLSTQSTPSQTQVIVVLPVKNTIEGNDHNWVYLGAMDQLISSLTSSNNAQIMNVDYVLDLMQLAKIPKIYSSEDANRIFDVSGATLIVESKISGTVEEYQLEYNLHFKHDLKRGVILEKNLHDALHKLSRVIADQTGQSLSSISTSQNAFINELMARSIEKFNAQDFEAARTFLITLKQLEPDNLTVRELLVKSLVKLQATTIHEEAQAAFELAKAQNKPEPATLHTFLAMADLTAGKADSALAQLDISDQLASVNSDILYQAYNGQIRGFILQQKGDFTRAENAYLSALKYYGIIRCPVGIAITHIDMSKLFSAQEKHAQATKHLAQAKALIAEHKLGSLIEMIPSEESNKK